MRKLTCSNCGLYKEAERAFSSGYCRECSNQHKSIVRPTYAQLSPEEKKKCNVRSLTNYYLKKGIIKRQPCEVCDYEITQFHHEDYDKPLQVKSLCRPCHLDEHRKLESGSKHNTPAA